MIEHEFTVTQATTDTLSEKGLPCLSEELPEDLQGKLASEEEDWTWTWCPSCYADANRQYLLKSTDQYASEVGIPDPFDEFWRKTRDVRSSAPQESDPTDKATVKTAKDKALQMKVFLARVLASNGYNLSAIDPNVDIFGATADPMRRASGQQKAR
jgi:hypothetical protein